MKKINIGPFLIMLAAGLWALDGLIRVNLSQTIPPASVVFYEHLVGFIILSPLLIKNFSFIKKLNRKDWFLFIVLTIVSSVTGTLLFTSALQLAGVYFDFTSPTLLQKLQPLFVIGMSVLFLKEKLSLRFVILSAIALIGSYLVTFGFTPIELDLSGKLGIYLLSIGAAFSWGAGTILSKSLLTKFEFQETTLMRFGLAIPVSLLFAIILGDTYAPTSLSLNDVLNFVLIAIFTGAGAILIYYKGLKTTEAKVSTIAELTFPIVSILIAVTSLNPYGAPQKLNFGNIIGIIVLLTAIILISLLNNKVEKPTSHKR